MYNVAICDDDKKFIGFVKEIIRELGLEKDVNMYEYLSGEKFLFDIDDRYDLDLLILDIQMKDIDGNKVAVEFRKRYKNTTLIFCSGIYQPAPEHIKVAPFRFLLKEYTRQRMIEEFKEIFDYLANKKEEPALLCYNGRNNYTIHIQEIFYISIARRGTEVHTYCKKDEEERIYSCKKSLQEVFFILQNYGFAYAHNSYIVNLRYICKQNNEELQMINGQRLSVSRARSKELKEKIALYFDRKYKVDNI